MNIVIIEDELFIANDLAQTIKTLQPDVKIEAILTSVQTAVDYFQKNKAPDLIFSDVQLGDGLSFEIFKTVNVGAPIVFCTAYDEYALNAFKTKSIDYILKPSTSEDIAEALKKYRSMRDTFSSNELQYKSIVETLLNRDTPKSTAVLVHYKDKIVPVRINEIALFYIENEITYLITFDKNKYSINKTLDELEQLCSIEYFRANRQILVNRKAIVEASQYFSRKLSVNINVPFPEKIIVSKERVSAFLKWLETTI